MEKPMIVFVCGVNGVGKTTLLPFLRSLLPADRYILHDFDERGVPENAGAPWRASETRHWIELATQERVAGFVTIVCGFVKVEDFGEWQAEIGRKILCMFLDASPDAIRSRLTKRYTRDGVFDPEQRVIGKTIREFIEGNVYIRDQLKHEFERIGSDCIDTTTLRPEEVAKRVIEIIEKSV